MYFRGAVQSHAFLTSVPNISTWSMSLTSHSTTSINHTGGPHSQSSCGVTKESCPSLLWSKLVCNSWVQLKGGAVVIDRKLANVTLYLEDTVRTPTQPTNKWNNIWKIALHNAEHGGIQLRLGIEIIWQFTVKVSYTKFLKTSIDLGADITSHTERRDLHIYLLFTAKGMPIRKQTADHKCLVTAVH